MSVKIDRTDPITAMQILSNLPVCDRQTMHDCLHESDHIYLGLRDDKIVCVWGLTTPTFCSDRAYLWLYTTSSIRGNEFLFVRHSQLCVQEMLKEYGTIVGIVNPNKDMRANTQRWLSFLGATFSYPNEDGTIPFEIRRR